jgi:chromosome segregation protein
LLKLKKVQILGFKSFCDRTEVQLSGEGIAAIVGPNGCGKSNISDAITWVLGEQSAKSLRGIKMEDVIFAGTRDRKPTGMAEVSLTLVDPEVYDGATLSPDGPEVVVADELPAQTAELGDWDEAALRQQRAQETEDAVVEAQPGTIIEGEAVEVPAETLEGSSNVVLKIRRRKFNRAPVRAGELTITRRLFRSGESEYLLNGKICRLRDIQDIFMGTGLGGESYAIIGQERIGQLLSSKPLDRRGIIEEAAGITRFKTKKRLAELRLESAKQNLARVNDIFEEVTRQMGTLKRQAAKAERYGALRDELRSRLRVVLASRMAQLDAESTEANEKIAGLGTQIDSQAAMIEQMDAEHTEGISRGYTLDQQIRETGSRANQSAVELERIAARTASNKDRVAELMQRLDSGSDELAQAREQLTSLAGELEQHRSFLENATTEATSSRESVQQQHNEAQEAMRALQSAEQQAEQNRRQTLQLVQRASQTRNEEAQASASLASLEQEAQRLERESEVARQELETLGLQRGQVRLSFESVTERLKRLETEIAEMRLQIDARRKEENESKRRGDQLRGELATLNGRRNSLEGLIRDHSYSTDTVRNIFKSSAAAQSGTVAPVGTLADFLEVEGKYESVVDEFLRDELNYVVVKSWDAADAGMQLLQTDVAGRATFLVHPNDAQANFSFAEGMASEAAGNTTHIEGVVPLRDCVRVLDGFGKSLEVILPKLREGYVAPDSYTARTLALSNPHAFFLSPTGETFHNVTVTGGRPRAQGPLALKRELTEVQQKIDHAQQALAEADLQTAELQHQIAELNSTIESRMQERRDSEREAANSGAALRQMESEAARIERRLQEWSLSTERNRDARSQKTELISRKQQEAATFETERAGLESSLAELQAQLDELRSRRERLQQSAAEASAALAGLEERRRNAQANFDQTSRLYNGQNQRIQQIEQQLSAAAAEKLRREEETSSLATQHTELAETRANALAEGESLTAQATELRSAMAELDQRLRTLRHETEGLREERAAHTARAAKLASDIEHIDATCLNDLGVEAATLRSDEAIARIEGDALHEEEEASRGLKQKLEAMGPVNMMALDEYNETTQRHTFLETQRKDLLDSIENTQASIKEIDEISRQKFDEAYRVINENFSITFSKLFGGGQAFMKLTDAENSAESGIDIVASPPGKKLQNVLLLSGGEKALTALSLLVGIFQYQPAPFCILDEVDAPLDETNVGRFSKLIADMSSSTQFVVITHSKRTMAQADIIYGVTMQEPGVSKVVSVNLNRRDDNTTRRAVA